MSVTPWCRGQMQTDVFMQASEWFCVLSRFSTCFLGTNEANATWFYCSTPNSECSPILQCVMCFQLIEGNKNAYASVINDLHPPVITRYVRLIPVTVLSTTVCMRVELYGCPWEGRNAQTRGARRVLRLSGLLISAFISSPKCLLRSRDE